MPTSRNFLKFMETPSLEWRHPFTYWWIKLSRGKKVWSQEYAPQTSDHRGFKNLRALLLHNAICLHIHSEPCLAGAALPMHEQVGILRQTLHWESWGILTTWATLGTPRPLCWAFLRELTQQAKNLSYPFLSTLFLEFGGQICPIVWQPSHFSPRHPILSARESRLTECGKVRLEPHREAVIWFSWFLEKLFSWERRERSFSCL